MMWSVMRRMDVRWSSASKPGESMMILPRTCRAPQAFNCR